MEIFLLVYKIKIILVEYEIEITLTLTLIIICILNIKSGNTKRPLALVDLLNSKREMRTHHKSLLLLPALVPLFYDLRKLNVFHVDAKNVLDLVLGQGLENTLALLEGVDVGLLLLGKLFLLGLF